MVLVDSYSVWDVARSRLEWMEIFLRVMFLEIEERMLLVWTLLSSRAAQNIKGESVYWLTCPYSGLMYSGRAVFSVLKIGNLGHVALWMRNCEKVMVGSMLVVPRRAPNRS